MAFASVLCGRDDWESVASIVGKHESWLRQFLAMKHCNPSHDTFDRGLSLLDPEVVS